MSTIQTFSGRAVDPLAPTPQMFTLTDIAHALGNLCRFTGHVREFYSVAQHSVHAAELAMLRYGHRPGARHLARWCLLHDAGEMVLADLAAPIKRSPMLDGYRLAEAAVDEALMRRFNLGAKPPEVKIIDRFLVCAEAYALLGPLNTVAWREAPEIAADEQIVAFARDLTPWPPVHARKAFLAVARTLFPEEVLA